MPSEILCQPAEVIKEVVCGCTEAEAVALLVVVEGFWRVLISPDCPGVPSPYCRVYQGAGATGR